MYKDQRFWDRVANAYANNPIKDLQAFDTLVGRIREYVKQSDMVLDFGCGTGTYSLAIADKVKSIHAIDISENMLKIARERAINSGIDIIDFDQLDIFDVNLQPASYSVVIVFNILHLQQDIDNVLARIKQLLTPGGLLISKTVCTGKKFIPVVWLLKPFIKLRLLPDFNCISLSQLQHAISSNDFQILETAPHGKSSIEYFIVAQK